MFLFGRLMRITVGLALWRMKNIFSSSIPGLLHHEPYGSKKNFINSFSDFILNTGLANHGLPPQRQALTLAASFDDHHNERMLPNKRP